MFCTEGSSESKSLHQLRSCRLPHKSMQTRKMHGQYSVSTTLAIDAVSLLCMTRLDTQRWYRMKMELPPEAWLRYGPFSCSITYSTIRPTGNVSCRMLGDIGHLPYNMATFLGHHGFNNV